MTSETLDGITLSAISQFREARFALHWLHPRQKRPIGKNWQEASVVSLEGLRRSHRPGNNTGVRLGEPSQTPGGFLYVLDLDIRIDELADECWEALERLLPGYRAKLPTVASGSGGASRHLYFVTSKIYRGKRIATSEGKHRREVVDPETGEVKEKWSFDWEIEIFGTGKQVVMPPSIHPDTGKPYTWEREFDWDLIDTLGMWPEIPAETIDALGVALNTTYAFETRPPLDFKPGQLERELGQIPVSELHYDDWIRLGQALHHQFGGSQEGFDLWLKHTRRSKKYTGENQDREMRGIKWRSFGKYRGQPVTMASIRQWAQNARIADLRNQFDEEEEDASEGGAAETENDDGDPFDDILGGPSLAPKPAAVTDLNEFTGGEASLRPAADDWLSLLDLSEDKGAIKSTLHNIELIVRNDPRLVGLPQLNEFTMETVQRADPGHKKNRHRNAVKQMRQLGGRVWQVRDTLNGEIWSSARDAAIRSIIEAPGAQGGYGVKVSDRDLKNSILLAAWDYAFHPVREYLTRLIWDGVPRVEQLFTEYVGAPVSAYTRDVSRLMMVGAVTRVFEPGHKFDFAVILEGVQGKRKSTFIRTLGKNWFAELEGDFHNGKEMVEKMQGAWIMEIPELSSFNRADVEQIKAFVSRQSDKVRLAYEARAQIFYRQCILIGSTNNRNYLKDDTGGRRFWPMECRAKSIDINKLHENIDQLWAEAYAIYQAMRKVQPEGELELHLINEEAAAEAARLQESRRVESVEDAMVGIVQDYLERPVSTAGMDEGGEGRRDITCLIQVWCEGLGEDARDYKNRTSNSQMMYRVMSKIPGWERTAKKHRFPEPYLQQRTYIRIQE